jgi:hypothetical protein
MRALAEIVPLRTSACREAADAIVMVAAGEAGVEPLAGAHVATCLRCQAEVTAYRRVMAVMRAMQGDVLPLPTGGIGGALEALRSGADPGAEGHPAWAARVAYVGGITAATAASAAGMLVWLSRRRPGFRHAS